MSDVGIWNLDPVGSPAETDRIPASTSDANTGYHTPATIIALHTGDADPHPGYTTAVEADALAAAAVSAHEVTYDHDLFALAADLTAHIGDAVAAHAASAVSYAGTLAATDVAAALDELDGAKAEASSAVMDGDAAGGVLAGTYPSPSFAVDMATQAELTAHLDDGTDAHDASAISFAAATGFTATNAQAAIVEAASDAAAALTAHEAAGDPHPAYALESAVTASLADKLDTTAAPELIRDTMGAALVGGDNVTITPSDAGDTITIDAAGGGGGAATLDDLTDVTITAGATGDVLRHNGTAWVDSPGTTHFEAAGAVSTHEGAPDPHTQYATNDDLDAHLNDTTDAHDATAISYAGSTGLSATTVEAALDELDTEKSSTAHNHDGDYEALGAVSTHSADTTAVHGIANTANLVVGDGNATDVAVLTAAAYAALGTKDANTLYFVSA